jgi:hypothetical protein
MNNKNIHKVNRKKSKIGFFHGILSLFGGVILGYLVMMTFSKYMPGDYAIKIIPSIILTPIIISLAGLWLLFSQTLMSNVIKFTTACTILFILIKVI